jgi:drug/metabolite transporter (DMT)-like permease
MRQQHTIESNNDPRTTASRPTTRMVPRNGWIREEELPRTITTVVTTPTTPPTILDTTIHKNHHGSTISMPAVDSTTTPRTILQTLLYILSGCLQPILMTICRTAGLANSSSQLYMFFYYLGPALVILPLLLLLPQQTSSWPGIRTIQKACGIAMFDICSQTLNYTGASLAGPTIFAIVYSSVTVWTAVFSHIFLGRTLNAHQGASVLLVFGGLTLTATDSARVGGDVLHGLILVVGGSVMHALTYVLLEGIMTVGDERLTIAQNCAIQGLVAASCFLVWQLLYTIPRWEELIGEPMKQAGTTVWTALGILLLFAGTNLVHAMTFLHTLRHVTGGATSAGVLKGLQAVLVFVATDYLFCGSSKRDGGGVGGEEMCFTRGKFLSLITVVSGVTVYGMATTTVANERIGIESRRDGYTQIQGEDIGTADADMDRDREHHQTEDVRGIAFRK